MKHMARMTIPNFSRDTRPKVRLLAGVMAVIGVLALSGVVWLMIDRARLAAQASDMQQLGVMLAAKAEALRSKAAAVPAAAEFEKLRGRIIALNRLDFDASVSVGGLLDELEAILPEQVVITSLGYDRTVRSVDLAAVSVSSADLTSFFDILDKSKLFSQVRLIDKMQVEAESGVQTQVRMYLQVGGKGADALSGGRS